MSIVLTDKIKTGKAISILWMLKPWWKFYPPGRMSGVCWADIDKEYKTGWLSVCNFFFNHSYLKGRVWKNTKKSTHRHQLINNRFIKGSWKYKFNVVQPTKKKIQLKFGGSSIYRTFWSGTGCLDRIRIQANYPDPHRLFVYHPVCTVILFMVIAHVWRKILYVQEVVTHFIY